MSVKRKPYEQFLIDFYEDQDEDFKKGFDLLPNNIYDLKQDDVRFILNGGNNKDEDQVLKIGKIILNDFNEFVEEL